MKCYFYSFIVSTLIPIVETPEGGHKGRPYAKLRHSLAGSRLFALARISYWGTTPTTDSAPLAKMPNGLGQLSATDGASPNG